MLGRVVAGPDETERALQDPEGFRHFARHFGSSQMYSIAGNLLPSFP